MQWIHLVARTRGQRLLLEHAVASDAWRLLRRAFPSSLATCLMPNHLHLLCPADDPEAQRRALSRVLVSLMAGRGDGNWEPVPLPSVIPNASHLRRQVRYVALNPCRDGLVRDPLEWAWSTHRDVMGAVSDAWVTAEGLAAALGERTGGFRARHHAYVSSDPSVNGSGTPPPEPAPPSRYPEYGLTRIAEAVAAARRELLQETLATVGGRRLFVSLARRQGHADPCVLAGFAQVSARTIRRAGTAIGLDAAALCLGDERLRPGAGPARARGPGRRG